MLNTFSQLLAVQPPGPGVDDLERAGERNAEPPHDFGQAGFGPLAERGLERRPCRHVLQDRAELDLGIDAAEGVDALLQALGDGQVPGLDDVAAVGLRSCLPDEEQVVELVVDEVLVTLEVVLVRVQARCGAEEMLKPADAGHRHVIACLSGFPAPGLRLRRTGASSEGVAFAAGPGSHRAVWL